MPEAKDNWKDWVMEKFELEEAAWKAHPGNNEVTAAPSSNSSEPDTAELLKQMAAIAKKLGVKLG